MVKTIHYDLNQGTSPYSGMDGLDNFCIEKKEDGCIITLNLQYYAVYGMGERFNRVNQKGLTVVTEVIEQFCGQGEVSYCPVPFFFTDTGVGLWLDTLSVARFDFGDTIRVEAVKDSGGRLPELYLYSGSPREILEAFSGMTGRPSLVPKWSLGIWISANRWNTQAEVSRQLRAAWDNEFPVHVAVIEAWSDESTFYTWNGHGQWENPDEMVLEMKKQGVHLVLWQIPVLKKMEEGQGDAVLEEDWNYAAEHNLCIRNLDGTPYSIPKGHWFAGSLLPDFTNPETVEWWFSKRQYLLDMGVDGFKTDGGEFILRDDVISYNGHSGLELRNEYAAAYVRAYSRFIGKDRILFSRAGYCGQQNYPMQWAGDQMSTWEEFRHIVSAGISAGLSGIPYWGFDIAGFAGAMPSVELYERATQMAVFAPVMQWHSEPAGGQYPGIAASADGVNDRSPWNMAEVYAEDTLLERLRFHHNLRVNLLPYLYDQAVKSSNSGLPMMKHLILEYPNDREAAGAETSFLLGDLLVAPVLEEGQSEREVYLPDGEWYDFWAAGTDQEKITAGSASVWKGGRKYIAACGQKRIPVFIRSGGCVVLNLGQELSLGSRVCQDLSVYTNLCFFTAGQEGKYHFQDDLGNEIVVEWKDGIHRSTVISGTAQYHIFSYGIC